MALYYAGGPRYVQHSKPVSAFSRGDLLCFDSGSSTSYCDALFTAGVEVVGVALSSSTESVSDKVPYILAHPDTRFWITATAANAGAAQRGKTVDLTPASGDWELAVSSTNSAIAYIWSESSTDATIQSRDSESNDSWVIVSIVSSPVQGTGAVG
jgi:hypothetical protein